MTWIEKNADNPDKDFKRGSYPQQVSHPMIGWVKKIFAERRFKQPPYLFQQQQKKRKVNPTLWFLRRRRKKKCRSIPIREDIRNIQKDLFNVT